VLLQRLVQLAKERKRVTSAKLTASSGTTDSTVLKVRLPATCASARPGASQGEAVRPIMRAGATPARGRRSGRRPAQRTRPARMRHARARAC
jgi:hypothetical protein